MLPAQFTSVRKHYGSIEALQGIGFSIAPLERRKYGQLSGVAWAGYRRDEGKLYG